MVSGSLWSVLVLPVLLKVLLLIDTVAPRVFMSHLSRCSAGRCRLIELRAAGDALRPPEGCQRAGSLTRPGMVSAPV